MLFNPLMSSSIRALLTVGFCVTLSVATACDGGSDSGDDGATPGGGDEGTDEGSTGDGPGGGVDGPATIDGWNCSPLYYDMGDGCDCGCGIADPDCGDGGCAEPGCGVATCGYCYDAAGLDIQCGGGGGIGGDSEGAADGEGMAPEGEGEPSNVPDGWTCADGMYDDGTCNCGCGVVDAADCSSTHWSACTGNPDGCSGAEVVNPNTPIECATQPTVDDNDIAALVDCAGTYKFDASQLWPPDADFCADLTASRLAMNVVISGSFSDAWQEQRFAAMPITAAFVAGATINVTKTFASLPPVSGTIYRGEAEDPQTDMADDVQLCSETGVDVDLPLAAELAVSIQQLPSVTCTLTAL